MLHIFPFRIIQHVNQAFVSHIVPPVIPSSNSTQCVSNCVTLQPSSAKCKWESRYQIDSQTKVLLDRLSINDSMDKPAIVYLPVAYCTSTIYNILG